MSACAYVQSDQSLCLSLDYSILVKVLIELHLEFLSLKGGCSCSSQSTLVKYATLLEITCSGLNFLVFLMNPLPHRDAFNVFANRADPDQAAHVRAV